jgi:putative tryptophan/tyrosine transport system substrate-binding protein
MQFDQRQREVIALICGAAAAWPLAARAQQSAKLRTVGFSGQSTRSAESDLVAAFMQRLRELGWMEGRTITIEYRWAEGREERFVEIAAELVRLKVELIVGAKPADLPVEQPTKFDLVVNLTTAKALRPLRAAYAARPRRRGD